MQYRFESIDVDQALIEKKGRDFGCGVDHFDENCDDILDRRICLGKNVDSDERGMRSSRNSLNGSRWNCRFGCVDSDESSILEEQNHKGTNC